MMTVHRLRYRRWYFLQVLRILDYFYRNPSWIIYSSYFFNFLVDKAIATNFDPLLLININGELTMLRRSSERGRLE